MEPDEIVEVRPGVVRVTKAEGERFYVCNRKQYWSVTTLLGGAVAKPYLLQWAAKETALAAITQLDTINALVAGETIVYAPDRRPKTPGALEVYRMLTAAKDQKRDTAAELGSRVHDIAEAYALGTDLPIDPADDIAPFLLTLKRWFDDFQPDLEVAEAPVFSDQYGYAGTMDVVATFDGRRLLCDYKTGKHVYPEAALQLAAYRHADFLVLPDGSTQPIPKVDGCAVVHIRPGGYRMYEVKADEETLLTFRYAQEMFRWSRFTSQDFKITEIKPREVV